MLLNADVTDTAVQEQLRKAAEVLLCQGRVTTCSVTIAGAVASSGRRLQVASGTITFTIVQDLYGVAEVDSEAGAGEDGGGKVASFIGAQPSVLDTANPVVASFGTALLAGLPAGYSASLVGLPAVSSVSLSGEMTTLGTDQSNIASGQTSIASSVATDLGLSASSLSVAPITVCPHASNPSRWYLTAQTLLLVLVVGRLLIHPGRHHRHHHRHTRRLYHLTYHQHHLVAPPLLGLPATTQTKVVIQTVSAAAVAACGQTCTLGMGKA